MAKKKAENESRFVAGGINDIPHMHYEQSPPIAESKVYREMERIFSGSGSKGVKISSSSFKLEEVVFKIMENDFDDLLGGEIVFRNKKGKTVIFSLDDMSINYEDENLDDLKITEGPSTIENNTNSNYDYEEMEDYTKKDPVDYFRIELEKNIAELEQDLLFKAVTVKTKSAEE